MHTCLQLDLRSGLGLTRKFATVALDWLENLARAAGGVLDWLENLVRAAGGWWLVQYVQREQVNRLI
jgi:hypothetical protein